MFDDGKNYKIYEVIFNDIVKILQMKLYIYNFV